MFPRDRRAVKPFAVGIHQEILHELPTVKPYLLRQTIRFYQQGGKGAYWRAILNGGSRYHLDGTPEGDITVKDQEHARAALAAVEAWWHAKRAMHRPHVRVEEPSLQSVLYCPREGIAVLETGRLSSGKG